MAHGTRGRWVRATAAGFGVMLCTGLVGCKDIDKPKDKVTVRQPSPGLPNLQPIGRTGQQPVNQQYPYGTPGIQQTGGTGQMRPGTGMGGGMQPTGTNFNTGGAQQYNYPAQPGNPGSLGTPAQPGLVPSVGPVGALSPAGGPTGMPGPDYSHPAPNAFASNPPAPPLTDLGPLPPRPPSPSDGYATAGYGAQIPPPQPIVPGPVPPISPNQFGKGN